MAFLQWLSTLRTPFFDVFFLLVTALSSETVLIVLGLLFLWCLNKRDGYLLLCVGFSGTILNQFFKLLFRVPRPWILDPTLSPVPEAIPGASGYSFPSGHTQLSVSLFSCLAYRARGWRRWVLALPILLVPFSRMYLGVHTPSDVFFSFALAILLSGVGLFCIDRCAADARRLHRLLAGLWIMALLYLLFVLCYPFPDGLDTANYTAGLENAYTLLGTVSGLLVMQVFDARFLHYTTHAPLLGQCLKLLLGLALTLGVMNILRAPLTALCGTAAEHAPRYFFVVLFAGCLWPMTFPFFARLGRRRTPAGS